MDARKEGDTESPESAVLRSDPDDSSSEWSGPGQGASLSRRNHGRRTRTSRASSSRARGRRATLRTRRRATAAARRRGQDTGVPSRTRRGGGALPARRNGGGPGLELDTEDDAGEAIIQCRLHFAEALDAQGRSRCNYCNATIVCNTSSFKQHLGSCREVPEHVQDSLHRAARAAAQRGDKPYGTNAVYRHFEVLGWRTSRCLRCDAVVKGGAGNLRSHRKVKRCEEAQVGAGLTINRFVLSVSLFALAG